MGIFLNAETLYPPPHKNRKPTQRPNKTGSPGNLTKAEVKPQQCPGGSSGIAQTRLRTGSEQDGGFFPRYRTSEISIVRVCMAWFAVTNMNMEQPQQWSDFTRTIHCCLCLIVRERQLRLYGHVARLPTEDPAHRILSCDPRAGPCGGADHRLHGCVMWSPV